MGKIYRTLSGAELIPAFYLGYKSIYVSAITMESTISLETKLIIYIISLLMILLAGWFIQDGIRGILEVD
jgi:cytochrome c biogenesis protein CcdA